MTIQEKILISGTDDWVYLAQVVDLIRGEMPVSSGIEIMEQTILVVAELAQNGLIKIGDLSGAEGRFSPWKLPIDESLARIRKEWLALSKPLNLGEICWLANTPEGDARVAQL